MKCIFSEARGVSLRILSVTLLFVFAGLLLNFPLFDLDEALYRRMAEEMKHGSSLWVPHWDGVAVHDKPPFFIWLILATSWFVDFGSDGVSILAARLPSLVFSFLTAFSLQLYCAKIKKAAGIPTNSFFNFPVYFLFLFPLLAMGVSLIDVPLAFFLLLCFCGMDWVFRFPKRSISALPWLLIGLGMGVAVMLKGLIGMMLPGLAFVITWGLNRSALGIHNKKVFLGMTLATAMATLLGTLYYSWIWFHPGGPEFVRDFFMVHHFGRGTQAMEGHSGSFFYHYLVIFLGGGPGLMICAVALASKITANKIAQKPLYYEITFPLVWTLLWPTFFGFMATKLPSYAWPAWMGLTLLLVTQGKPLLFEPAPRRRVAGLFLLPQILVSLSFIALGVAGTICHFMTESSPQSNGAWPQILNTIVINDRALLVARSLTFPPLIFWISLCLVGVLLFCAAIFAFRAIVKNAASEQTPRTETMHQAKVGVLVTLTGSLLLLGSSKTIEVNYSNPLLRLADHVKSLVPAPSKDLLYSDNLSPESVAIVGLRSPALSSALDSLAVVQYHKGSDEPFELNTHKTLIFPIWLENRCLEKRVPVTFRSGIWIVCSNQDGPAH